MIGDWFKKLGELFGGTPPPSAKPVSSGSSSRKKSPAPKAAVPAPPAPASRAKAASAKKPTSPQNTHPKRRASTKAGQDSPQDSSPAADLANLSGRSTGYMLVVGLDFGTAYTKVVVRDALVTDPGKAYPVQFKLPDRATCFFPSVVYYQRGDLFTALDTVPPEAERIDYLKMRLVAAVEQSRASAWAEQMGPCPIQVTVAWFLARVLAAAGTRMSEIWPDFGEHPEDYCFINICVPIAYSDGSPVEATLMGALYAARAAVGPAGTIVPTPETLARLLDDPAALRPQAEFCYAYPETSSNLQSYLKSRSRKPGLYLLLDVGAGTVDLTFFQLLADESNEAPLRYYHAAVLDAGSSRLELLTVQHARGVSLLDALAFKEGRLRFPSPDLLGAFAKAQKQVHDEVGLGVGDGVRVTESKLHPERRRQLENMKEVRLIFSGGGFIENPYELASRFFQKTRQWTHSAPVDRLSNPTDLDWGDVDEVIPFNRLSVAYGLSFPRYALENHRFPSQIGANLSATPTERAELPTAPTKDDV